MKKYTFNCQICGKQFTTSYPQTKACKIHRDDYRKQHLNELNRANYQMVKAYKEYLAR